MTSKESFREQLLKENGLQADAISSEDMEALQRILKRDKARARRMKWLTVIIWGLFLTSWMVGAVLEKLHVGEIMFLQAGIFILYVFAIVFTISFAIRSWMARNREFLFRFTEVDARLESVEESLKRLAPRDGT